MVCHGTGVGGSPMLTDAAEWNARRAKGKDALYASAINGFIGTKGAMPARGANPNLSDAEVKAAVDYMLETAAK
jgi:cytochrome c5